ncbi:MAG TPA: hypothetical protein VGE93_21930 [Bryobacteraceae bacterium]
MASPSVARLAQNATRYIRWPSGNANYRIELNSDVIHELDSEIAAAEKSGAEIGGVLLGSLELSPVPTLRVESFEIIAPGPEQGPLYLLSPQQQEEFAAVSQRATAGHTVPVGFFRSHLRSGPLALSLADKGFLWKQFRSATYLALLIEAPEPHKAHLSVWKNGQVAFQSSIPAFPFDEERPEPSGYVVPVKSSPETFSSTVLEPPPAPKQQRRTISPDLLVLCSVIVFAVGIVLWPVWQATFGGPWAPLSPDHIGLSVQPQGSDLRVTWDQKMPEISRAEGATLTILDGPRRSEVLLGRDDLKFGSVVYPYASGKVEASLALNMGNTGSLTQSAIWQKP